MQQPSPRQQSEDQAAFADAMLREDKRCHVVSENPHLWDDAEDRKHDRIVRELQRKQLDAMKWAASVEDVCAIAIAVTEPGYRDEDELPPMPADEDTFDPYTVDRLVGLLRQLDEATGGEQRKRLQAQVGKTERNLLDRG